MSSGTAEGSCFFVNRFKSRCFAFAQHDIQVIPSTKHSLAKGTKREVLDSRPREPPDARNDNRNMW